MTQWRFSTLVNVHSKEFFFTPPSNHNIFSIRNFKQTKNTFTLERIACLSRPYQNSAKAISSTCGWDFATPSFAQSLSTIILSDETNCRREIFEQFLFGQECEECAFDAFSTSTVAVATAAANKNNNLNRILHVFFFVRFATYNVCAHDVFASKSYTKRNVVDSGT